MAEILEVFDLEGTSLGTQDRSDFYKQNKEEYASTGKVTRQVRTVRAFIITPHGRVFTARRSKLKQENSGLYDKTVGGHVIARASYDATLTSEAKQELGITSLVVKPDEFDDALRTHDLGDLAVFRQIDYIAPFDSIRINKDGTTFTQPLMSAFYLGYYKGPIKFEDGECDAIQVFSLDDLREEIKTKQQFTHDLKFMVEKYGHLLMPLKR